MPRHLLPRAAIGLLSAGVASAQTPPRADWLFAERLTTMARTQ